MRIQANNVDDYLAQLPPDRREALQAVRKVILSNLDKGYEEGMQYGMIGYYVPHSVFPPGYHCDPKQPLPFAGMASQKNHMSLYLMCIYGHDGSNPNTKWFQDAWKKTGKKLDMGKACVRFKRLEDVALDVIGEAIRRTPVPEYIHFYQDSLLAKNKAAAARAAKRKGAKGTAQPAKRKSAVRKPKAKAKPKLKPK
jgi:hypothetical protein